MTRCHISTASAGPTDALVQRRASRPERARRTASASSVDEGQHGRTGTGDDGRNAARPRSSVDQGERLGHRGPRCRWCRKSSVARSSWCGLPAERRDEQSRATGVGGRVGVRHGRPAAARAPPRCVRRAAARTRPRRSSGSTGDCWAQTSSPVLAADHEPAEQRRRDVVGMALEPVGERQRGGVVEQRRRRPPRGRAPARCRRRWPPTTSRAPGCAGSGWCSDRCRPGGCDVHGLEGGPHRADDQVALVAAAPRPRPRPATRTSSPSGTTSADERVAQLEGEPEAVEARARGWRWSPGTSTVTGPVDERHVRPHVSAARRPRPPRPRRRHRRCRRGR